MLDEKIIRSLAAGIEQARKTHELIRPVTAQFPEATIEDAYAIQRAWAAIRNNGRPRRVVVHRGVSLQNQGGKDRPRINVVPTAPIPQN